MYERLAKFSLLGSVAVVAVTAVQLHTTQHCDAGICDNWLGTELISDDSVASADEMTRLKASRDEAGSRGSIFSADADDEVVSPSSPDSKLIEPVGNAGASNGITRYGSDFKALSMVESAASGSGEIKKYGSPWDPNFEERSGIGPAGIIKYGTSFDPDAIDSVGSAAEESGAGGTHMYGTFNPAQLPPH